MPWVARAEPDADRRRPLCRPPGPSRRV